LDGSLLLGSDSLRTTTRLAVSFSAAFDGQGMFVGELDVEVVLLHTRKFTLKRVRFLGLLEIEAGVELSSGHSAGSLNLIDCLVEEVEESDLGADGCAARRRESDSWEEERHVSVAEEGRLDDS